MPEKEEKESASMTWVTERQRRRPVALAMCSVGTGCSGFDGFSGSFSPWRCGTPCCWRGGSVTASSQVLVGPQPLNEVVFGAVEWQAAPPQFTLKIRNLTRGWSKRQNGTEGRDRGKVKRCR